VILKKRLLIIKSPGAKWQGFYGTNRPLVDDPTKEVSGMRLPVLNGCA